MSFVAGQYTGTLDAGDLGQIENGFTTEHVVNKRLITGDNEADTPQDAVFRGHEFFVEFILMEYDAQAAQGAFYPYDNAFGTQGVVGRLDVQSDLAKPLVLTAIAGTPAVGKPASVTASRAILQEGFPVRLLFAPDLRDIPIRQRLYQDTQRRFFVLA